MSGLAIIAKFGDKLVQIMIPEVSDPKEYKRLCALPNMEMDTLVLRDPAQWRVLNAGDSGNNLPAKGDGKA